MTHFTEMFENDNGALSLWGGVGGEWSGLEQLPAGTGIEVLAIFAAGGTIPDLPLVESTYDAGGGLVPPGRTIAVVDRRVRKVHVDRLGEAGRRLFGVTAD